MATGLGPHDNPDLPLNIVETLAEQYGLAVDAPAVLFNGSVTSSRKYVLVNNLFFERVLRGERRHGVVIIMSCDSLYAKRLIDILAKHGFDVYIGWRGLVAPEDIDAVLPLLFDKVLSAWSRGLRGCVLLRSVLSEMGSRVIARHTGALMSGVCR